jgi:hypothetical protein
VAASALPTSLIGHVDDSVFGGILADLTEYVPDLVFPNSIGTYGQMRHDPQITGVLSAHMWPIRRASWSLDPTGCRDEVVLRVADDVGLPVQGDDKPGAARVRGVLWPEHIRVALLHVVYGFMAFEMEATVADDGAARLTMLSERMPQTVADIKVNRNGTLAGIDQVPLPGEKQPQIGADRLVWYAHEREGASWQGRSILRAAFAPWLLKREMLRVHGTSNQRFGMGVPVVEWAQGTNPTPAQIEQGQKAASAARAGQTAGLSTPPGARIAIKGLEGAVPDTLAFIRYLDQQISRMCLATFLDLGTTDTGARALGETFVDFFTMSISSIAEAVASEATRQICARIVAWNWGDTEPVPQIRVSDVGTKHEVTAEALNQLLQSGALSADPELEAWVRRTYRLPPRDPNTPTPTAPPKPTPAVAAARRGRSPQRQLPGQTALAIAAAASDPIPELDAAHQQVWQDALAELQGQWPDLSQPMVDDLAAQAGDDVDSGDLAALGTLAVSAVVVAGLAGAIGAAMLALAALGAGHVVAEAKAQGKSITAPDDLAAEQVDQVAQAIAGILANGYASAAARKALQVASSQATAEQVQAAVAQVLTDMGTADAGWVADNLGAALSAGQQAGRFAVLAAHPPDHLYAQEHHDASACEPCEMADRRRYDTLAEAEAEYGTGGYVGCLGGLRCRGTVIGVW